MSFSPKLIFHFIVFSTAIATFSHCQNLERWKYNPVWRKIDQILKRLKNKNDNQIAEFGNLACIPEGFDSLRDVLPDIVSHLNIKDLHTLRSVCKEFKGAADREIFRRSFHVQIVSLSRDIDGKTVSKALQVKPKLALFFSNYRDSGEIYESFSTQLMAQHWPQMPKSSLQMYLGGVFVMVNNEVISQTHQESAAVFLPENERIAVRYGVLEYSASDDIECSDSESYPDSETEDSDSTCLGVHAIRDSFVGESFPLNWASIERHQNFAYIYYAKQSFHDGFRGEEIWEDISEKYQKNDKKFALWGGKIDKLSMSSTAFEYYSTLNFGASISGPGVKAWSLLIDTNADESKIMKKITDFKRFINLKSKKTLVLSMITSETNTGYTENFEGETGLNTRLSNALNLFEKNFPGSSIITYGINKESTKVCTDSWIELEGTLSPDDFFHGHETVCYLIISYS